MATVPPRNTLAGLPGEIRDRIYGYVFSEEVLVVLAHPKHLLDDGTGPKCPDTTTQMTSRYRMVYPGTHATFKKFKLPDTLTTVTKNFPKGLSKDGSMTTMLQDGEDRVDSDDGSEHDSKCDASEYETKNYDGQIAHITSWLKDIPTTTQSLRTKFRQLDAFDTTRGHDAPSLIPTRLTPDWSISNTGILYVSHEAYKVTVPHLYKSCTFFFEDPDLSKKFLEITGPKNLESVRKIAVHYNEGDTDVIVAPKSIIAEACRTNGVQDVPVWNIKITPLDITRAGEEHVRPLPIYLRGPPCGPSVVAKNDNIYRWMIMCNQLASSLPQTRELTVWTGDTLDLQVEDIRCLEYEAALLQLAALKQVKTLDVKKHGDTFDNSGDENARWFTNTWANRYTIEGIKQMIRTGDHGALNKQREAFLREI